MVTLELDTAEFAGYLQNPTDVDSKYAVDVYSHLGGFCFLAYSSQESRLESGGVRHGLAMISRLIRIAAKLYPVYAEAEETNADPNELREILLRSSQTPLRFAGMPNTTNHFVESHFGLKNDQLPEDINELYRFEAGPAGDTLFITDNERFWRATAEAEIETPFEDFRLGKQCPMTQITEHVVWPGMVNLAADTPEAFAQDLSLVDN